MTLQFSQITTLFLACMVYMLGVYLVKQVGFLKRFCIPEPVVGGLIVAIVITILKSTGLVVIELDTSLQSLFMLAFFTTIGLGASFKLLKVGGKVLIAYWLLCGFLALMQNVIGVSVAKLMGLDPLLGVMLGAISMEGGHGAAAAFGQTIESLGIDSAVSIGLAAATFGLIAGGLIGGPVVKYLINKHDLKPNSENATLKSSVDDLVGLNTKSKTDFTTLLFIQMAVITGCMTVGGYLGSVFSDLTGFALPGYVGAMFVAVIFRNITDTANASIIDMKIITKIGDFTLGIFLSMALMSIKLWDLYSLALPLFVVIFVQVLFIVLLAIWVGFRVLGKDYDAAIMTGGFLGHGLGATPNAIANMDAVTKKFGDSPKAFLIVPLVGAFLIDLIALPIILTAINIFS
ncbi:MULTISPECIES: sodium/glutamate symporter [unclassified Psychrobacter]|uniref:sodium/glutamate symporter n=1 Tax=unclassified Psychrobacter TaxID=196806 RepID=UPI0025B47A46|nr:MULTISPECIES: sodium/glutamate symporter [unclassified Psychrobacter]MDN3454680.1 sodium/glutamate symporter [Psychrobacter sp. APC 3350]MDN3503204.1 sodium/glutamate symporter [Psychrobacter sp. 5A.1]